MAEKTDRYTVDGAPLFVPLSPFQVELESLADPNSGRTDDGVMHVLFTRPRVRKFTYRCGRLTGAELRYLENLVQGRTYTFGFALYGGRQTMEAYTSAVRFQLRDLRGDWYDDVEFTIIEL